MDRGTPASGLIAGPDPVPGSGSGSPRVLAALPTLDAILAAYAAELGPDRIGYSNHAYRVVNLCAAWQATDAGMLERIVIAAAFHDLGIWTDHTFDYLEPSVRLAVAHLRAAGQVAWIPEVAEMIRQHHKLSRYRSGSYPLVEPFRRADWIDVSRGVVTFGLRRARVKELLAIWPSAGFHRRLVELELARLRSHPWNPLPMFRL